MGGFKRMLQHAWQVLAANKKCMLGSVLLIRHMPAGGYATLCNQAATFLMTLPSIPAAQTTQPSHARSILPSPHRYKTRHTTPLTHTLSPLQTSYACSTPPSLTSVHPLPTQSAPRTLGLR